MALTTSQRTLLFVVLSLGLFVAALQFMGVGLFTRLQAVQEMVAANVEALKILAVISNEKPCVVNTCVFFDININSTSAGRIVIRLFDQKAPKTVENFRALATGERGISSKGTPLHYNGTNFNRVVHNILVQGGDIFRGHEPDDEDLQSIDASTLENETENDVFDKVGLVAMATSGPARNAFEFMITMDNVAELNGLNVVFGELIEGLHVVQRMNSIPLYNNNEQPVLPVAIVNCGQL